MPMTNGDRNNVVEEQESAAVPDAVSVGDSCSLTEGAASANEGIKPKERHSGYAVDRDTGGIINCETGLPVISSIVKLIRQRRDSAESLGESMMDSYSIGYNQGYVAACDVLLHLLGAGD